MKIPEHIALSYLLAQFGVQQQYGWPGTALMIVAGCLPDADGLTILGGWQCYRRYHRRIGHGLPVTLFGPMLLTVVASLFMHSDRWLPLWFWLQVSLLAHLYTDYCFYRWPIQFLWPLSSEGWELGLLRWNDVTPTIILYLATIVAIVDPNRSAAAAAIGTALLGNYLIWRIWHPRPITAWGDWLAGSWTQYHARYWRWLTGDFVTD